METDKQAEFRRMCCALATVAKKNGCTVSNVVKGADVAFRLAQTYELGDRAMNPVECKEHAAECRQMAECAPNSRVQAILMDMARTWDRLTTEAEIAQKSRSSLRVISDKPSKRHRALVPAAKVPIGSL
jgi:hypothetical protein